MSLWQVNLAQPAKAIHDWIRGHDKVPGAWTVVDGQVRFPGTHTHTRTLSIGRSD